MSDKPVLHIEFDLKAFGFWKRFYEGLELRMRRNLMAATNENTKVLLAEVVDRAHYITGTLKRSWGRLPITDSGASFSSGIGSNLVYAPIEEYGFDGMIRAHSRRVQGRDVTESEGMVSTTDKRGRVRTREKRRLLAAGVAFVKAHHRKRYAHPYVRPGVMAAAPIMTRNYKDAIKAAVEGEDWT